MSTRYRIGECIGVGGMGEVYLGSLVGEERVRKSVAIKRVLRKPHAQNDKLVARFIEEARLAATMHHPNIVDVFELGRDDQGEFLLVMEHVDGVDLFQLIASCLPPLSVAIYIAIEILRGLDYVHELAGPDGKPLGIVHRDLSTGNVLLSWDGGVKVSDFGLARAFTDAQEQPSDIQGTPHYLSPEQVRRMPLDRRSDLFAVGVVLYQLLTRKLPFQGADWIQTIALIERGEFTPPRAWRPDVPADLEAITLQLLAHDRDQRPDSARVAIRALQRCEAAAVDGRDALAALLQVHFRACAQPTSQRKTAQRLSDRAAAEPNPAAPAPQHEAPQPEQQAVPSPNPARRRWSRTAYVSTSFLAVWLTGLLLAALWPSAEEQPQPGARPDPMSSAESPGAQERTDQPAEATASVVFPQTNVCPVPTPAIERPPSEAARDHQPRVQQSSPAQARVEFM